jgi:hypothetical protein
MEKHWSLARMLMRESQTGVPSNKIVKSACTVACLRWVSLTMNSILSTPLLVSSEQETASAVFNTFFKFAPNENENAEGNLRPALTTSAYAE